MDRQSNSSKKTVNAKSRNHENSCLLAGRMFGPYSFININDGREEMDDVKQSCRNMVEVAVVWTLVRNVYQAWKLGLKHKLRIGIISPYSTQVEAIKEKIGRKYEKAVGFSVKVVSADCFHGGQEDIIIISTVRSNTAGGTIRSSPQIINVALAVASQCLWILGNKRTLCNSGSDWEALVHDAKERQCFFNADEDKELAKTIFEVKKEFDELDDLLDGDSVLLRCAKWKVHVSESFRKSFEKLSSQLKIYVLNVLLKLASGWRPKRRKVDSICARSSQILKRFKVEGLYIICSIDIVKERRYIQVLKVWDILPLEDIPGLVERLDGIFETYTDDFIRLCKEKSVEGVLEVPKTWSTNFDIVRHKNLTSNETGSSSTGAFMENSKVSESLLLMKFYSLSSGVVKHLLSDRGGTELVLPFEVTDEERDIILFQRSSFILGRSGTGKTTVLTMKLCKKEQLHRMATEGFVETNGNTMDMEDASWRNNIDDGIEFVEEGVEDTKKTVLRQLFVTFSPKLCYAVKQHVCQLIR